jgi:hypothetical protein
MSWKAITFYQPIISPKARLGIAALILVPVSIRCIMEWYLVGFSPEFWLYAGFVMVTSILEWKHFNKPREISIQLIDGRLEYCNQYTNEMHTVYKSRTQQIKQEKDFLVFYSSSQYTTKIPLQFFHPDQVHQLCVQVSDWKVKSITYAE